MGIGTIWRRSEWEAEEVDASTPHGHGPTEVFEDKSTTGEGVREADTSISLGLNPNSGDTGGEVGSVRIGAIGEVWGLEEIDTSTPHRQGPTSNDTGGMLPTSARGVRDIVISISLRLSPSFGDSGGG